MDQFYRHMSQLGCLKVTPAHDPNDKVLGEKYNLEFIDIFNEDASLNELCLHYQGVDRVP